MADKKNPLFVHAVILIVLGAAMAIYGSVDLVKSISARDVMYADMKARSTAGSARSLTRVPSVRRGRGVTGALGAARQLSMQGRRMKSVLGRFARYGPALILGIGMIVVGVFVIKEKNWARIVSFALFGAAAMIVVSLMAVRMGSGGGLALPLTAIVLVTFGAAKLEWDLMVENFEPAAA